MLRPYNFSAGPATMPEEVLRQAAEEMLDWPDASGRRCGMGVMEMSHRGKEFTSICEQAESDLRELLHVPPDFRILFMQGGGLAENAIVPLNLSALKSAGADGRGIVDFVLTGSWSEKSFREAGKYCHARVAASGQSNGFTAIPDPAQWRLSPDASYLHLCTNETIHGVEFSTLPDLRSMGSGAELVIDFSSHVASRAIDWSRVGLAFGGAQKNLGPAGLTLVVVREDLLDSALPQCPSAFQYKLVTNNHSMYNFSPRGTAQMFAGDPDAPPEQWAALAQTFAEDRAKMRTGVPRMPLPYATVAYTSYLRRIASMLDGQPFLLEQAPCLADFAVYHPLWFTRTRTPVMAPILDATPAVLAWMDRMQAIGHGVSEPLSATEAIALCQGSTVAATLFSSKEEAFQDAHGIALGSRVTVAAESFGQEPTEGELVAATRTRYTLRRSDDRAGTVRVHFPRIGFILKKAAP